MLAAEIAEWRRIAPHLSEQAFPESKVILRQGEDVRFLYCLTDGVVRLSHLTESGARIVVGLLGRGDIFGGLEVGTISQHAASAVGHVCVLAIAHPDVTRLQEHSRSFRSFLGAALETSRLRAERKLIDSQTKTLEARLIETLCELALMFGAPCPHGFSLEIRLTQQDIADLVHASRPVVTKLLNGLRRRGALDYTRDLICVNDATLRSVAQTKASDW